MMLLGADCEALLLDRHRPGDQDNRAQTQSQILCRRQPDHLLDLVVTLWAPLSCASWDARATQTLHLVLEV